MTMFDQLVIVVGRSPDGERMVWTCQPPADWRLAGGKMSAETVLPPEFAGVALTALVLVSGGRLLSIGTTEVRCGPGENRVAWDLPVGQPLSSDEAQRAWAKLPQEVRELDRVRAPAVALPEPRFVGGDDVA